MNYISIDLELNQPSNTIISIGAVVGNIFTGEVKDRFHQIVYTAETIAPHIIDLTGITQHQVNNGMSLFNAYCALVHFMQKNKAFRQPVCWGNGDMFLLKSQVSPLIMGTDQEWVFGLRFYDAKTVYQTIQVAKGRKTKAGLVAAMNNMGLAFTGTSHNAQDDAENTFVIFYEMLKKLRSI